MKAFPQVALLLLIAVLLAACDSGFLDQTNPNQPTADSFWETETDAIRAVNAVYDALQYEGTYQRMAYAMQDLPADDTMADSPWIYTAMGNFTLDATNLGAEWMWRDLYQAIYRANQAIAYIPEIENMDADLRERLIGEAKFLRAFLYMHLVNLYVNVPMPLEPAVSPEDYNLPQSTPEEVWAQIYQDLQDAQAVLPETYPSTDVGRATWGAATAYLGKAYLFNERWSDAAGEFKDVIDSGIYDLVDDPRDNANIEGENNVESIFEIQFTREVGGTEPSWISPPLVSHGETHARSMTYAPLDFGWADIEATPGLLAAFLEEETVEGEDDPRLRATLFFDGEGVTVYGVPFQEQYPNNLDKIFWRKYQNDVPGGSEDDRSGINFRTMRYADVLLYYAETQIMLGNFATAAEYIQETRDRANLPDRTDEFAAMSQDELMDVLAHERFLEFAGEGRRWDDIRRWGWFDDEEKRELMCAHDPEMCLPLEQNSVDLYFPIPQVEMDINPLLEQNPGY